MVEALVIQRSNPIVHRLAFSSMSQDESEPIQNYLVRLRAVAVDCNFSCPSYEHDLSDIYIKDPIIRGVANNALQADLLAKAGTLKILEQNVRHLNHHCETKLQWLVLLTQPPSGYQHTADRRACHRPTKGTSVPMPIPITRLNRTARSVGVVAATCMAPQGPGLAS